MDVLPEKFIALAQKLLRGKLAAFLSDAIITQDQGFDYLTQQQNARTQTIKMIRVDYKESQFNGDKIKVGDYMLVGEYQLLAWEPSADNTTIFHDGIKTNIKLVNVDPAKATIFLSVRRA